ncbi:uncharacterized protein CEXT_145241 [Caerostris extrusa]|uniref:Endonuclease/exonuclease/phosphatase domain-containing protein n=1 Tax=Caerostris extrusa TaxID=172846 RepID=A0AAV4PWM9_CAEEX|nr:uncharacterized protein CEXT_145241 [Caerostris extrusa]
MEDKNILLTSLYSSPSEDISTQLNEYEKAAQKASQQIICGDFNAHSTIWGYNMENIRGQKLTEFIAQYQLHILNPTGSPPTFIRNGSRGWPDLTLSDATTFNKIQEWKSTDYDIGSDHLTIHFQIQHRIQVPISQRYKTKFGNFKKFTEQLKTKLSKFNLDNIRTTEALEQHTNLLIQIIQSCCDSTFKRKKTISSKNQHHGGTRTSKPKNLK